MKNRELIIALLKHPMEAQVVIGNLNDESRWATCSYVEVGCYIPEEPGNGEFYEHTNECNSPEEDGCVRAVCLYPEK